MTQRKLTIAVPGDESRPQPAAGPIGEELLRFGAMGKALSLLEAVAGDTRSASSAELARLTGMTKPTAHRIVTLLEELGFVERDPLGRGYVEGPRLTKLALDVVSAAAARNLRRNLLSALSEKAGETCNFGILLGAEVVYVDRVEAKWPLGLRFEAGSRVPAHCTAIGKLLLSLLPQDRLAAILAAAPLTRYTANSVTDAGALQTELAGIGKTRTGTDDQEFMSGVVCVAVPVEARDGRIIGAIALSAPEARMTLAQLLDFAPAMRETAGKLASTYEVEPN